MKTTRSDQRIRRLLVLALATMVFSGACVSGALADPSAEGEAPSALLPEVSPQALEEAQPLNGSPVVDTIAAEELPRSDLDRAEAEELLTAVFPALTEEATGIFNDLEVEEFHSDHVAVVNDGEGGEAEPPALLESLLPLRTESQSGTKEQVDLELEPSQSGLLPVNPLVAVRIPDALGEGIALPESGIQLKVVGAPEDRAPSIIDGSAAFFPNIAPDTDLVASPTPMGLETFTQLRSPQAPLNQTFALAVPQGAEVKEESAGLKIVRGEEVLAAIPQPTAVDATGSSVPVSSELDGDLLTLKVEPTASNLYPLVLDPYVETFAWTDMYTHYEGWYSATNSSNFLANTMGIWGGQYGLNLKSTAGTVAPDAQANWNYYVPRYFSDYESLGVRPSSYIDNLSLSGMYFWIEEATPYAEDPMAVMGIWDGNKGAWANSVARTGAGGMISNGSVNLPNKDHVTDVKSGGIALLAAGDTQSRPRHLWVPQASVEITDNDSPAFATGLGPSHWLGQSVAEPITFSASDSGLGMYSVLAKAPKMAGGSSQTEQQKGCVGNAASPCPRTWSGTFTNFNPASMAQGEDVVELTAKDPIGHLSAARLVKVKVDHTAPSLALSGNLTEQAQVGTKLPSYTLNYATTDGDDATATALTPYGITGTAEGQLERPQGLAIDASGNIWVSDRINNRITEYGPTGGFIRQINTHGSADGAINEPRGLAVSPAGNVWVAENANKRLQEFSPTGAFIAKITNAAFVEPWGVAPAPGGALWVSDPGAHKLFKFSEAGILLTTVSSGGHNPTITAPYGIAVDSSGNVWMADTGGNKILEFDSSGNFLFSFGTEGTGNGQLKAPTGLAITPSGHLFVSEDQNSRVQELQPDGRFLRQFGTLGSAANQLTEPRQVAIGPENSLLIADAANHRIARWSHADQDPQSGVAKVEVKVDGATAKNEAPGCSTKNCQVNGSWTLNAANYTPGSHKVEVIATDAVGLASTKTLTIENHADLTPPSVALSGSMTEQEKLGTTRPSYKLKLSATDSGSAEEWKSGVISTTIKVDGKVVDSVSPGCSTEACSITREWTLESSAYSVGAHTVEAIATDGAGHTTAKTLAINIERDATAPELRATNEFYVAPGGWLEQKSYLNTASATDVNGYGIVSLVLKIDGETVKSSTQTCPSGGCSKMFANYVDTSSFSGGAHPAELIATDGAGNVTKKTWTIRIDPSGSIEGGEAGDTIEAVEETAPEVTDLTPVSGVVSPPAPIELEPSGQVAEPTLVAESGQLVSSNAPTEVILGEEATEGFSMETMSFNSEEVEESASLQVIPIGSAPSPATVEDEASAVYPDTHSGGDSVVRPVYDGVMSFQNIREDGAPESYSWQVLMGEGEELRLIDERHAGVFWEDGTQAMLITVGDAHGADGETIPTSLSISDGSVITMTVHYHQPGVVYPIVSGVGWEGGFVTYTSEIVEPEPLEGEVESQEMAGLNIQEWAFAAPEHATANEAEVDPSQLSNAEDQHVEHRRFRYIGCHIMDDAVPPYGRPNRGDCGNPFIGNSGGPGIAFNYAIKGSYYRVLGSWVKHTGNQQQHIDCAQMLEKSKYEKALVEWKYFVTQVKCEWYGKTKEGEPVIAHYGKHITPYGEWHWGNSYSWEGPWEHHKVGLALYIWADKDGYIGHHETTCIDC